MKTSIEHEKYDTKLEASDWRFSAAIFGLIKYLRHHNFKFEVDDEYLYYNSQDICEEKYLEFVEYQYKYELHHTIIENKLSSDDISDEQIKIVNEKLVANTIMKNTFKNIKFGGTNKEEILRLIESNRNELIKETYRNKSNMYKNYCNKNQLFNEDQDYCRLLGYAIDAGKKGKSIGYNFSANTFVGTDILEFDFIPFAFGGDREAFFINDNITLERLENSNDMLKEKIKLDCEENKNLDVRRALFKGIIESSDFIDYDVEVIFKDRDKEYFETLYFRKDSIDILKQIKNYKVFCFSHKVTDKYYINVQKEVTDSILNSVLVDELIELFLNDKNRSYLVKQLIDINVLIRSDKDMDERLKGAYACAKQVVKVIPQNKIDSYRQKLISSIILNDYDKVCKILLQLSNYSNIEFGFVYKLYDDFEKNKDLAYTFINALSKGEEDKNTKEN